VSNHFLINKKAFYSSLGQSGFQKPIWTALTRV